MLRLKLIHISKSGHWEFSMLQYIPRNMHTVFALLCFVVVIHWLVFPYPSGLLHWHCGNLTIAPVPAKQPWWIWINTSREFIMNDCIVTTKQSTTKPCAYFLDILYMTSGALCNTGYPPETHLKLSSREISFVHKWWLNGPIVLKFCTEHGSITFRTMGGLKEILRMSQIWRDWVWTDGHYCTRPLWPLLLTWFNFNPSMDK